MATAVALLASALVLLVSPAGAGAPPAPGLTTAGSQPLFDLAAIDARARTLGASAADASCPGPDPAAAALSESGVVAYSEDRDAGHWKTWLVQPGAVAVPPPPAVASAQTARELVELHAIAAGRNDAEASAARRWDKGSAVQPWTELLLEKIAANSHRPTKNPPRISRHIAMFQTAVFDALVITWRAKYCYLRPPPSALDPALDPIVTERPLPSYPSEHATVAGVAKVLLPYFFPVTEEPHGFDGWVLQAANSRLWGSGNYRSDVDAGLAIGIAVGRMVRDAREGDGWNRTWDGSGRIEGRCNWEPSAPGFVYPPLEPVWGKVTPWLMSSGSQFRPGPPPRCDGAEYKAAARDVYDASLTLDQRQKDIAQYWAGGPGTVTPPGLNLQVAVGEVADHRLTTMRAARVLAHLGAVEADAAIAAWDTKFTYWWDRPVHTIRRLWDRDWLPLLGTPPFPGYISGHATFSGASSQLLSYFFPDEAVSLRAQATEAAISRFYGGIHARYDNEVGLAVGQKIADLAIARARADGAA